MPPHQRRPQTSGAQVASQSPMPSGATSSAPAGSGAQPRAFFPAGPADNRWVNSTLLLLSQKLRYAARNDKVLEHNMLVVSKRLRQLEERLQSVQATSSAGVDAGPVKELLESFKNDLVSMRAEINEMRETAASREQVAELKALVEAVNPLDFVTINQVKEIVDQRIEKKAASKAK